MFDDLFPAEWVGRRAIVSFPGRVDISNAGQLRDRLLAVIGRGAALLIADMSRTASCDHAAIEVVARACQRAAINGTQVRLVVTAPVVRRVLSLEGLDRLVPIYPSVEAATGPVPGGTGTARPRASTARRPAPEAPGPEALALEALALEAPGPGTPGPEAPGPGTPEPGTPAPGALAAEGWAGRITPATLWNLFDALGDGLLLAGSDGKIAAVNRRCAEMFGYAREDLAGLPIDVLVPSDVRGAHLGYRAAYHQVPEARPMAERARLAALRRDGATVPVEISLSPVPTASETFVLAVIRDASAPRPRDDLVSLARGVVGGQSQAAGDLLDRVVHRLFRVGLILQAAGGLQGETARARLAEAMDQLDDVILEIRDYAFTSGDPSSLTPLGRGWSVS